jgi:hypothetical protein
LKAFNNDYEELARHIKIFKNSIKIRRPDIIGGDYPAPPKIDSNYDKKSLFITPRGSQLEIQPYFIQK